MAEGLGFEPTDRRRKCTVEIPAPTGLTPNCIRVLVERDSASAPDSHAQNSPVKPGILGTVLVGDGSYSFCVMFIKRLVFD